MISRSEAGINPRQLPRHREGDSRLPLCILWPMLSANTKYSINELLRPALVSCCRKKFRKNFAGSHPSPRPSFALGRRPYSPANFRGLDRASLQSDPVAAATVSIKRVRSDSVKGWFMTKLLTPYLVSTACGKPGSRSKRGNDWRSGRAPLAFSRSVGKNRAEFIYFFHNSRHALLLVGRL